MLNIGCVRYWGRIVAGLLLVYSACFYLLFSANWEGLDCSKRMDWFIYKDAFLFHFLLFIKENYMPDFCLVSRKRQPFSSSSSVINLNVCELSTI